MSPDQAVAEAEAIIAASDTAPRGDCPGCGYNAALNSGLIESHFERRVHGRNPDGSPRIVSTTAQCAGGGEYPENLTHGMNRGETP